MIAWQAFLAEIHYNEYESETVDVCSTLERAQQACRDHARGKYESDFAWKEVPIPGFNSSWQAELEHGAKYTIWVYSEGV